MLCFWGFCLSCVLLCCEALYSYSLQQRTLLHCLKHLVCRAFTLVTYVHHCVTGVM